MTTEREANLGFARVDLERARRCRRPEVIYCPGKLPAEVAAIARALSVNAQPVLATRAEAAHFEAVRAVLPEAVYEERARCIVVGGQVPVASGWPVGVICAGTADLPVTAEAIVTLRSFGHEVEEFFDVGVAGLHRLLEQMERIRSCGVLIVVAGMEGALPSVVSGLVSRPLIAVPTSVGYGASLGGVAALLGMLNSCGSGMTVVNIDNGFGAACAADDILHLTADSRGAGADSQ